MSCVVPETNRSMAALYQAPTSNADMCSLPFCSSGMGFTLGYSLQSTPL